MTGARTERARTVLGAATAGVLAARATRQVLSWPTDRLPGGAARWTRTNHRGQTVTLAEGPAWVAGAVTGILGAPGGGLGRHRAAAVIATLAGGGLGLLDDLAGDGRSKGLKGHVAALTQGRVTTGAVKVVGLAGAGILSAVLARPVPVPPSVEVGGAPGAGCHRRSGGADRFDVVLGGAVVAGAANLVNLFDLRPGRALKVVLLVAGPLLARGVGPTVLPGSSPVRDYETHRSAPSRPVREAASWCAAAIGASVAALPADLDERTMLGDTGANAAGALLGTAFVARTGRRTQVVALAVLAGLTVASERISFTQVIERSPLLAGLDRLGRRPAQT